MGSRAKMGRSHKKKAIVINKESSDIPEMALVGHSLHIYLLRKRAGLSNLLWMQKQNMKNTFFDVMKNLVGDILIFQFDPT